MPPGAADVFFPSDFALLAELYRDSAMRYNRLLRQHHGGHGGAQPGQRTEQELEERLGAVAASTGELGGAAEHAAHAKRDDVSTDAALSCTVHVEHAKSCDFMRQHAERGATATRSGWQPLLDDYTNTAALLAWVEVPPR